MSGTCKKEIKYVQDIHGKYKYFFIFDFQIEKFLQHSPPIFYQILHDKEKMYKSVQRGAIVSDHQTQQFLVRAVARLVIN